MNGTDDAARMTAFLTAAASRPAGLLIEGEPGIGRTTTWLAGAEQARRAGFRVLSARAVRDEQQRPFGVASQLIGDVEPEVLLALPTLQRQAAEQTLWGRGGDDRGHDRRAVVAAFTAIVNALAEATPVLIAIDDVQWIDDATRDLLAFAGRRLRGPVGVLLTERATADGAASWLVLDSPDAVTRLRVSPMEPSRLQRLITDRLGRPFPRATMVRIAETSGGNPFYALELASIAGVSGPAPAALTPALAELVRLRVGHFDDEVGRVLLAAACQQDPTVDVLAAMTSTSVDRIVALLEEPETQGVVSIEGNRVRFTHPVLSHGVHSQAPPELRREMHRALADLATTQEQRARHLALAADGADPDTLGALDEAADAVDRGGDPTTAAELVEMAIGLGGDTPARRLAGARFHLSAGDLDRSRALAEAAVAGLAPGGARVGARLLVAATLMCRGEFETAATVLQHAMADAGEQTKPLLHTHLSSAMVQSSLGNDDVAQRHSLQAITHAERLGDPHLISQSLAVHVALRTRRGLGLDRHTLDRAIALEDRDVPTPAPFSASAVDAVAPAWLGRLGESESKLRSLLAQSATRGSEPDVQWLQFHAAMVDVWLGRYADAARLAEEMRTRAAQLGGMHVRVLAAVPAALAAAYTGREQDARREIAEALAESALPDGRWRTTWPPVVLGFLEVSLGNYEQGLGVLRPLLSHWQHAEDSDMTMHFVIPDAIEAMVALDDLDEADALAELMERDGARLRHPWLLATAARCRSMVLAARGDLAGAERAALRAMAAHEGDTVPFERARTQLLLAELQRRLRRRQAARTTIEGALATFDALGTPAWSARASAELARIQVLRGQEPDLTASEQRVAELAAAGMSNKDIAAALFISPKTVESNLGRSYRKLGVRTRVELARRLQADQPRPDRATDGDD
ncbi:transcriptional regulator [Mycolicibacterium madagascariense]|uniref:Transcriptional regulator n=2 Tax=Mycolicibacterium madagascariense TaxID=212765 RepID=A0A7I7XDG7_9MYCO|nr:transcriptional regulator [Mycolicibacterium madagascariense]